MDIILSNASEKTIYEQIYLQIKSAILSGELSAGEALPSIRGLAKDLRVSVITTRRAYEELERDGFVHSVAGKGCYVAKLNLSLLQEEHRRRLEEHLRAAVGLAAASGLSEPEMQDLLHFFWQEREQEGTL